MGEKEIIKQAIKNHFPSLTESGQKFKTMEKMIKEVLEQIKQNQNKQS